MDIDREIELLVDKHVKRFSKDWKPLDKYSAYRTCGLVDKKIKGKWAAVVLEYIVAQSDCHRCPECDRFYCYHGNWCYFTYHSLVAIDLEKKVAKKVFVRMKMEEHYTKNGYEPYCYGGVKILDIEEEDGKLIIEWKIEDPRVRTVIVSL
jgi:hypothetical protein